jgi:hypothetical protein
MPKRIAVVLAVAFVALVGSAHAQRFVYTGVPDKEVLTFFDRLQHAVGSGDRAVVAELVHFPLRVNNPGGKHVMIATRAELLRQYDAVFTPPIRAAILKERPDKLIGGRDGVAVGSGLVWISGTCTRAQPAKCVLGVASVNHL